MKKLIISSLLITAATCFAASNTYKIDVLQDSVIEGKAVKAGEYKLSLENGNAVLKQGKQIIEVPAHSEPTQDKVNSTEITYTNGSHVKQIELEGTRLKIVFDGTGSGQSGM